MGIKIDGGQGLGEAWEGRPRELFQYSGTTVQQ
jgi:hypothetical protein